MREKKKNLEKRDFVRDHRKMKLPGHLCSKVGLRNLV